MHKEHNKLYTDIINVTADYLGPAAERFVTRQIDTHTDTQPKDITVSDLKKLVDWLRLAMAFVTEDKRVLEEYADRLRQLANPKNGDRTNAY